MATREDMDEVAWTTLSIVGGLKEDFAQFREEVRADMRRHHRRVEELLEALPPQAWPDDDPEPDDGSDDDYPYPPHDPRSYSPDG